MPQPIILILIFVVGVIAIKLWQRSQAQQKLSALHDVAQEMNWTVKNKDHQALYSQLSHFAVFQRGTWKDIRGVLFGQLEGVEFYFISFRHGGMTSIPIDYQILFIEDIKQRLPALAFRHKKAGFILKDGYVPPQFELYPLLKQNYALQTKELGTAQLFLQPTVLNLLSSDVQESRLLEIEMSATQFLYYERQKGREQVDTIAVQQLVQRGIKIYHQLLH